MSHPFARPFVTPALLAALGLCGSGCMVDEEDTDDRGENVPLGEEDDPDPDTHEGRDASCGDDGCVSELTEFGLLCTTCPGDAEPECLVASCGVIDRCLECRDPKGRTGKDCSLDYESLPTASTGIGGGDTFHSCHASYGFPNGANGTCHYPGPDTCDIDLEAGCIECTYMDGSGTGLCAADPEDLPDDVLNGRPSILPPPGECITSTSEDGLVECSTCTREDLSATKACRMPPAVSCDVSAQGSNPLELCLTCSLQEGGTVTICDDAGH